MGSLVGCSSLGKTVLDIKYLLFTDRAVCFRKTLYPRLPSIHWNDQLVATGWKVGAKSETPPEQGNLKALNGFRV